MPLNAAETTGVASTPVAWRYELSHAGWAGQTGGYTDWRWHLSETEPHVPEGSIRNLTPLYASPPAPAPAAEPTEAEIRAAAKEMACEAEGNDNGWYISSPTMQHIFLVYAKAALRAAYALRAPTAVDAEAWIEREFSGHGMAVRTLDDPPIPGEPLMSMAVAKAIVQRALRAPAGPVTVTKEAVEAGARAIYAVYAHHHGLMTPWEDQPKEVHRRYTKDAKASLNAALAVMFSSTPPKV